MQTNLIRCSACAERPPVRPAQVTWAWRRTDGVRTAYRQNLCVTCFCTNVLPLDVEAGPDEPLRCPVCGIGTDDDYDAVYITAFIPGTGKMRITVASCGPCAVEVRNRAQKGATKLEDAAPVPFAGAGSVQGLAPEQPPAADVWAALGITPRDR